MKAPLAAKAGDVLFPGDVLSGANGRLTFFFCSPNGEGLLIHLAERIKLSEEPPSVKSERLDVCLVPRMERRPSVTVLSDIRNLMEPRAGLRDRIRQLPPGQAARLEAFSQRDLSDPRLRLAFGVLLQQAGLPRDAAWQYRDLADQWPAQPRLQKLVFDLVRAPGATREIVHPEQTPKVPNPLTGKTYALVIGISNYEQKSVPDLRFAANDANEFAAYLETPRGAAAEVKKLIDGQATSGAIRQTFNALYKKAGPGDSVIILVAAHGDMDPARHIPMVITHRADPQDLTINAFPMSELQLWLLGRKAPFGRAIVFLDVCHAGHFAEFQTGAGTTKSSLEYYGLLATHRGPDAYAFESDLLGTGHGAFTYFLLRGLNTLEAKDIDGQFVTLADLTRYVTQNVSFVTRDKQMPTPFLGARLDTQVADLTKAGLHPFDAPDISKLRLPLESLRVPRGGRTQPPKAQQAQGRDYPSELARTIEIENRGEDVLLKYLRGDEVAQDEKDFRDCKEAFHELLNSEPDSPYLEAREAFCEGRAEVFRASREKSPGARAIGRELLEQAIRLDPGAAYPYNALGILWLEQGEYDLAKAAFEDAIHLAPKWAYPRHNLALTLFQSGAYTESVQTYKDAMAVAPGLFYLPYSLGLVYQRMNRLDEADETYRQAVRLAPFRPEPYSGIGSIHALRGEWRQAEASFRRALRQVDPLPVAAQAARHNLALVLSRKSAGEAEAISLWKQNKGYVPSELSMARFFEKEARRSHWRDSQANEAAIQQYRVALASTGGDLHIQMGLAELLRQTGQIQAAIAESQSILTQDARDVILLESLGDLFRLADREIEACAAYQRALDANADDQMFKRLSRKKRTCSGASP